jgi:hypothetical protein
VGANDPALLCCLGHWDCSAGRDLVVAALSDRNFYTVSLPFDVYTGVWECWLGIHLLARGMQLACEQHRRLACGQHIQAASCCQHGVLTAHRQGWSDQPWHGWCSLGTASSASPPFFPQTPPVP